MEIIPAIDIIEGKCVRLTQGDYDRKTIYNENPLEVAKQFEGVGVRRLHLVDLDGARSGKVINIRVLEKIAANTGLVIDFGGGIKSDADIASVYNAGAGLATVGSVAVKDPPLFHSWIMKYGADKVLLGADVKNDKIAVSGWLEETNISVGEFIKEQIKQGIRNIFCTDISKDGLLEGPSVELYKKIISENPTIHLIASGGVSSLQDIEELNKIDCAGVIIGKAIYEERIGLNELIKTYH